MSHKVVIQMVSGAERDQVSLLRQVSNLMVFFSNDVRIEIIFHGDSLPLLEVGSPHQPAIKELMMKGVRFIACQNMLAANKKFLVDLVEGVRVVPSGIGELVLKQEAGWSYLKAGL